MSEIARGKKAGKNMLQTEMKAAKVFFIGNSNSDFWSR